MIDAKDMQRQVAIALEEDVGSGDITAALIPEQLQSEGQIVTREAAVICGTAWVDEVYRQLDPSVEIHWLVEDGMRVVPQQALCSLKGFSRSLLTGERTALNFLQLLSGTATTTKKWVDALTGSSTKLLDTRKTIAGLRAAQKYAVRCGGGQNHRMGLYDAYLIKENHIMACGSITRAVKLAHQQHPDKLLEVEVETLQQLQEALSLNVDIILLDNFSREMLIEAIALNKNKVKLEISGNIHLDNIQEIAKLKVDFISVGALTKHVQAIDLSLRFN